MAEGLRRARSCPIRPPCIPVLDFWCLEADLSPGCVWESYVSSVFSVVSLVTNWYYGREEAEVNV